MTSPTIHALRVSAVALLDRHATVEAALSDVRASLPRWESELAAKVAGSPLDSLDPAVAALDQKIRLAPKRIEGLQNSLVAIGAECESLAADFVAALRDACAEALAVMIEREIDLQRRHFPDDGTGILAHAAAEVAPSTCAFRLDASAKLSPPTSAKGAARLRWALGVCSELSARIDAAVGADNEGSREPAVPPAPVAPATIKRGPGRPRKNPLAVPVAA
jgi:hypothetical protein